MISRGIDRINDLEHLGIHRSRRGRPVDDDEGSDSDQGGGARASGEPDEGPAGQHGQEGCRHDHVAGREPAREVRAQHHASNAQRGGQDGERQRAGLAAADGSERRADEHEGREDESRVQGSVIGVQHAVEGRAQVAHRIDEGAGAGAVRCQPVSEGGRSGCEPGRVAEHHHQCHRCERAHLSRVADGSV